MRRLPPLLILIRASVVQLRDLSNENTDIYLDIRNHEFTIFTHPVMLNWQDREDMEFC